jgi:hypothetical protein
MMDEQVRTNRRNIEQLREDENAIATQMLMLQREVVQLRTELNEQSTIISLMCNALGIVPTRQRIMEH